MPHRITLEEQEKILLVAESLIRQPESWVKGQWKCPVHEQTRDEKGRFSGRREQKTDENGAPLFQYCVEGAVNEATLRILGKERALKVGAVRLDVSGEVTVDNPSQVVSPTELMKLDAIAYELHASKMGWNETHKGRRGLAMTYNDSRGTHEGVLNILRTGLSRVREQLGKKTRRKAA
jgi:hypothetical protein